jgi:hypothetical protein
MSRFEIELALADSWQLVARPQSSQATPSCSLQNQFSWARLALVGEVLLVVLVDLGRRYKRPFQGTRHPQVRNTLVPNQDSADSGLRKMLQPLAHSAERMCRRSRQLL